MNALAMVSADLFGIALIMTYFDRSHWIVNAYLFPELDFVKGPIVSKAIVENGFWGVVVCWKFSIVFWVFIFLAFYAIFYIFSDSFFMFGQM